MMSAGFSVAAQVNFYVEPVSPEGDITEDAAKIIYRKTEQILTRNSAAAAGVADVFGVRAYLNVTGKNSSSGLVRDVTSISGEFTLVAENTIDGARYYSVTVPVKTALKSGGQTPIVALANAIRPTDAVYTRFVRLAREKAEEYYAEHCNEVIGRANTLAASGQTLVAMTYLTGVPAVAPCHEESVTLLDGLRKLLDKPSEEAPAEEDAADDYIPEDPLIIVDTPARKDPEPVEEDQPQQDNSIGVVNVSDPSWVFDLREAVYLPVARKIRITAMISYVGKKSLDTTTYLGFVQALDNNGESFSRCYVDEHPYRRFPQNVPVKVVYYIDDVLTDPGVLSYVGLNIDGSVKVEIRNLRISR